MAINGRVVACAPVQLLSFGLDRKMMRRNGFLTHFLCWSCLVFVVQEPMTYGQSPQQWAEMRREMVDREVSNAGIRDLRVIRAMQDTPRHLFVSSRHRRLAYVDSALPIGYGQTISPPFVVAYMTEQLELEATDKVLEIGTGSGYQAAVLSPLVAQVYSIEIVEPLAQRASAVLRHLEYTNVKTKAGDGFAGWSEFAPYDKIIVTCSPEKIPQALVDQLKEGGRLVIPLGERFQQTLCLFIKAEGSLKRQDLESTFFVPMTGDAEALREKMSDAPFTELINGGFEQADEQQIPLGWYYVRQAETLLLDSAPEGQSVLRLTNSDRGRHAQVLQALGLDGRQVKQIDFSYSVRTKDVLPGQNEKLLPHIQVKFYNANRHELKTHQLGPWRGTTAWKQEEQSVSVPHNSRFAVLMIGMYGAVGTVEVDGIMIEARTE